MDVSLPRIFATLSIVGLGVLMIACSGPSRTTTEAAAAVSKPITTGETLQIIKTLNDGEIKLAHLALASSPNDDVRDVARLILDDHEASNDDVMDLAEKRGVELDKSPLSRSLEGQADRIYDELKYKSGPEFDCLFLKRQVKLHEIALETVSKDLVPDAELREVRELLSETSPTLERHREAARLALVDLSCDVD